MQPRHLFLLLFTLMLITSRAQAATFTVDHAGDNTLQTCDDATPNGCSPGGAILVPKGLSITRVAIDVLQRINANRNKNQVDTNDVSQNVPLKTVIPGGVCTPFRYHRKYGTVSNPIQLLPGSYQVTVTAVVGGKRKSKTVAFDLTTCDFNPTLIVDL